MSINKASFAYLAGIIKQKSGICLTTEKEYLIESRMLPVIKKRDIKDIESLVDAIKMTDDEELVKDVVEAITTNETSFFRDTKPFEVLLDEVMPEVSSPSSSSIKIWCAACSSGQEPYSIAITLLENSHKLNGKSFEITATDINTLVLEKAKSGTYSQFDVQRGLPITILIKYFTQEDNKWTLKDEVRKLVKFDYLNLLENFPEQGMGMFDIIFCRNVLIYFADDTRTQILENIGKILSPKGFLFLGSSETVEPFTKAFSLHNNINGLFKLAN